MFGVGSRWIIVLNPFNTAWLKLLPQLPALVKCIFPKKCTPLRSAEKACKHRHQALHAATPTPSGMSGAMGGQQQAGPPGPSSLLKQFNLWKRQGKGGLPQKETGRVAAPLSPPGEAERVPGHPALPRARRLCVEIWRENRGTVRHEKRAPPPDGALQISPASPLGESPHAPPPRSRGRPVGFARRRGRSFAREGRIPRGGSPSPAHPGAIGRIRRGGRSGSLHGASRRGAGTAPG